MIAILVRIFGFLLLVAFVCWTLYVFWLGLKSFFTPKPKRGRAPTVSLPPAGTTPAP